MLNKIEFEVQENEREIHQYIDAYNYIKEKKSFNRKFIIFLIITIILLIGVLVANNYIDYSFITTNISQIKNAILYSGVALALMIVSFAVLLFISSFQSKELTQRIFEASRASAVIDMDKYKVLKEEASKVNYVVNRNLRTFSFIILILDILALLSITLGYIFIIMLIMRLSGYIPEHFYDILNYVKLVH